MSKLHFRRILPYFNLALDLVLTQLSLDLAIHLRQQINFGVTIVYPWFFTPDVDVRIVICLAWAFFLSLFSVYTSKRAASLWAELKALGQALAASLGVLAVAIFLLNYDEFSRLMYLYFAVTNAFVLVSAHLGLRAVGAVLGETRRPRRVLIVGTGTLAQTTANLLIERGPRHGLYVVGFLSEVNGEVTELLGLPVLGGLKTALAVVVQNDVQEVIVALPAQAREKVASLFRALQDLPLQVRLVPDALDRAVMRSALEELAGVELLSLREPRLRALDHAAKRVFDLAVSTVGLVVISPLMALIAILIKIDSPGPVLFCQTRIGKNGRQFTFYKFRSMVHNADDRVHREYTRRLIRGEAETYNGLLKMVDDDRITRFGSFLRRNSLDELPQLLNVIKGEMSLVGPRPTTPYQVAEYQEWHKRRLETVPGMTGIWQVWGRSRVTFDEMARMDIEYIEHQSFWLDLKILLLTPRAVVLGKGAG